MFAGHTDDAVRRYRELGASWRSAGRPVVGLLFELAAAHALVNGGHTAEAAASVAALHPAAVAAGNPTVLCWDHYICGLTAEQTDPVRALAAYAAAVEHGATVDSRLFVSMAHVSAAGVALRRTPPAAVTALEETLQRWSAPGSELLQWWTLASLASLLAEIGEDTDAAVLAGAVEAGSQHRPRFEAETERLADALAGVRTRLGPDRTAAAMTTGAALDQPGAVAHARRALAAHRARQPPPAS